MYIELQKMVFYAYHGVMEQEQKVGNTFTVDLKLYMDLNRSIQTDRLDDTVNYAVVFDIVKEEMAIPSHLLEHVAGRIITHIKQSFPSISSVKIRLAKLNPPVSGDIREVAVIIRL
jgi:dihydroneopterin aldolase